MGKQPAFQFYVGDWMQDTRALSLAAKGAWIDLLCAMWRSQTRGVLSLSMTGYSRLIGATVDQTTSVIKELTDMQVCDCITSPLHVMDCNENVQKCNGHVTLINRRMVKEKKERELKRLRVKRFREKGCNGDGNGDCNGGVTPPSSSSSSKTKKTSQTSLRLGEIFFDLIGQNNPKSKLKRYDAGKQKQTVEGWAVEIDKLMRIDGQSESDIEKVIRFCTRDSFEKVNVLSGKKLRQRWDSLILKAEKAAAVGKGNSKGAVLWDRALGILRRGEYRKTKIDPPQLNRIIQKMGGWSFLGGLTEKQIEFKKKEFMELFKRENH